MIGLDEDLQQWVVTHRVGVLDVLMQLLSLLGSFGLVWIAIALAAYLVGRRAPSLVLTVAVGVFAGDGLATALKRLADRPRPYVEDPEPAPLMTTSMDVGFPSGHAATSFAGATILALSLPRLAVPLYVLAALVAISRVYVGVHYPLDIVAGALLGLLVGAGVWVVTVRRRRRPDQQPA